jgi:hypothetical protein
MSYQTGTVIPYWFKTTVLRKKLPSPSLYSKSQFEDQGEYAGYGEKDGVKV